MAYSDGYYYGQCKIVAVVDNAADNGKTVLITTDDNKTYSGTIANKKCEFLVPPRTLYTVQKVSGESVEFTTKVEAGYGDCILVHLDTGYVEVKQGDIVGLDYIKAATADNLKNKVPEATAVKELDSRLLANDKKFQFAYDSSKGSYGYLIDGTFKSFNDATALYNALQYSGLVTPDMSYDEMLQVLSNYFQIAEWDALKTSSSDWIGDSSVTVTSSQNNITFKWYGSGDDVDHSRQYAKSIDVKGLNTFEVIGNRTHPTNTTTVYISSDATNWIKVATRYGNGTISGSYNISSFSKLYVKVNILASHSGDDPSIFTVMRAIK